ncbi:helix-turn-helix domain-containing protein [Paraburkholderia sp.]|uniref:GlxA family transcriptional regulator n=1 Tax=Paraburkholderia sp. TaxID=1926495 RepID=UPI00238319D2|nr:helix-turn-helix domain-containing protein [Paraburkholderia sp.]MDE1179093.1 helix-turn-helix domain-containing protein [Paraburkholderia sp.]
MTTRTAPPRSSEDADPHAGRGIVAQLDRAASGPKPGAKHELNIGFLLWPSFPMLSLAGFCDALRHAADLGDQSRPLRCAWTLLGIGTRAVEASCGIAVPVEPVQGSPRQFDYLVVIGGLLPNLDHVDRRYWDYLHEADAAGVPLVGLCTGSFVLAKAGLMRDHVACVHAFHFEDYKTRFPGLRAVTHTDYLIDGARTTCAGGVSVIELATRLITLHCGPDRASKVIHQMTVNRQHGTSFVERRKALGYLAVGDLVVRHALVLMEENLEAPLTIAGIARMTGSSVRQLERNFLAEMGVSPKEFYRSMRLRYARWLLLNSAKQITVIAYECGFADAAHFIRDFKQVYGVTPGKLRASLDGRTAAVAAPASAPQSIAAATRQKIPTRRESDF